VKTINELILRTAQKYLGQKEIKGNSGFEDPVFWEKMKAVGFQEGEAWCALFAELVWREAYAQYNSELDGRLNALFSKSAVQTYYNFKNNGWPVGTTPYIGALTVWQMYKDGAKHWSGHIGISTVEGAHRLVTTIDGNTNSEGGREGIEVAEMSRDFDFSPKQKGLVLLGFIYPIAYED